MIYIILAVINLNFKQMKKLLIILFVLLSFACNTHDPLDVFDKGKWIDLTFSFDENSVYWPTNVPYTHDTVFYGINDQGYFYSSFKFAAEEHGGTHFDAPIHFGQDRKTVDQIDINQLTGRGVLIDVRKNVVNNLDYLISIDDFKDWESNYGKLPENAIVLVLTGHGEYYHNKIRYLGTEKTGAEAVPNLHFPGLSPEAAKWLSTERAIDAIGLDTPSIDYGQSKEFMAHRILCANDITVYENVANLDQLPAEGFYICAFPMKIKGGSGSPLRIAAFLPM